MPTYVLMTKLKPELVNDPKRRKSIGDEWKKTVERVCPEIKWKSHYALLGPYDFMDIYEAPNQEVATKVALVSQATGALKAESWTAVPYSKYLKLAEEIGEAL